MKHRWLMPALVAALVACLVGCNGQIGIAPAGEPAAQTPASQKPTQELTSEPTQEPKPSSEPEPNPDSKIVEKYGVGEPAEINEVTVTLTQVEESAGEGLYKPGDGDIFLLCHFNIENNSDEYLPISEALSFAAYVDDYITYSSSSATLSSPENGLYVVVDAGRKVRGVVGYEVNQDWNVLEIIYKTDVHSDEGLIFRVEKG